MKSSAISLLHLTGIIASTILFFEVSEAEEAGPLAMKSEGVQRMHRPNGSTVSETVGLHRSKAYESPFVQHHRTSNVDQEARKLLSSQVSSFSDPGDPISHDNQTNHERRLLEYLMRNYDSSIRPVRDARSPVVIKLGITLTQIVDLDEKNQVLTTNVWLDQEWMDEFLSWPGELFGNMTKIKIPCEKIWLPDIVLYNSADDYTRGYMNSRAMIEPSGNVFWPPPTKFRSTCMVDVTYFPFDDQTCIMKLGSWIYDGLQVEILNRTAEVDLSNYVSNGEWDLLDATLVRNVKYYSCCPEPFPDVTITITIRRKTLYYMYNVVFPCLMMSVLTLLVFCLPPDSGEKIALGVTVLLAFSVFMLTISEKLPETSESIPLLGIYLTAVMAITSVSVIMTVVVINIHYRGPSKNLPKWLKEFFLNHLVDRDQALILSAGTSRRRSSAAPSDISAHANWLSDRGISAIKVPDACAGVADGRSFPRDLTAARYAPAGNKPMRSQSTSSTTLSSKHPNHVMGRSSSNNQARDELILDPPPQPGFHQQLLDSLKTESTDSIGRKHRVLNPLPGKRKKAVGNNRNRRQKNQENMLMAEEAASLWPDSSHFTHTDTHIPVHDEILTDSYHQQQHAGMNEENVDGAQIHASQNATSGHDRDPRSDEMLRILRFMIRKQESDDNQNRRILEWRLLALAIDKILFWVFLLITFTSSFIFLLYIPIQRRGLSFLLG